MNNNNTNLKKYKVQVIYPAIHEYVVTADSFKTAINKAFQQDKNDPAEAFINYDEEPQFTILPLQN